MELFSWLESEHPTGLFIEANMCAGACLGGPVMRREGISSFRGRMEIDDQPKPRDARPAPSAACELDHLRLFRGAPKAEPIPTEEEILSLIHISIIARLA